ncbi:hypothetical protein DU53_00855 [Kosmotoga sp. DU53]|nr:hypothetical protein DU53_00855 [Kosmotoga sp. DU53]
MFCPYDKKQRFITAQRVWLVILNLILDPYCFHTLHQKMGTVHYGTVPIFKMTNILTFYSLRASLHQLTASQASWT